MTDPADLTAALRAHARGLHTSEAAIELLIGNASWLHRSDFVHPFVHTATGLIDGTPMASIDWTTAITALNNAHLQCSGGRGPHPPPGREPGQRNTRRPAGRPHRPGQPQHSADPRRSQTRNRAPMTPGIHETINGTTSSENGSTGTSGPNGRRPRPGSGSPHCPTGSPPVTTRKGCRRSATGSGRAPSTSSSNAG